MNLQNAQETVDQWIKTHGVRYFNELTNMAHTYRGSRGGSAYYCSTAMESKVKRNLIRTKI